MRHCIALQCSRFATEPDAMCSQTTIGWREWGALPELGLAAIKIKTDTGAKTSSLHAADIEAFEKAGQQWVRFTTHAVPGDTSLARRCEAQVVDTRTVRNSGGDSESRPVIRSELVLGGERWPIELTLADRSRMKFPMLLGRHAMRGRFLVNPAASYSLKKPAAS